MLSTVVGILGTAVLAVIGWAFQLNSDLNVQKQRHEDLLKLIDTKFDALVEANKVAYVQRSESMRSMADTIDVKFEHTNQRLERIERALNGALHRD